MSEETTVVKKTDNEFLIAHLNNFKKQVIDFALDLKRHIDLKEVNPNYQKPNQQTGKFQTVDELIEQYREGLKNAQNYVANIEALLKADEEGKLEELINSFKLIPSPVDLEEGKKE